MVCGGMVRCVPAGQSWMGMSLYGGARSGKAARAGLGSVRNVVVGCGKVGQSCSVMVWSGGARRGVVRLGWRG